MSQYLVALFNNANTPIRFVNKEDEGNNVSLNTGEMFRTKVHFNIPDISDLSKDFPHHHMEIQDGSGKVLFSFWDDTQSNYNMKYCLGTDRGTVLLMPGYSTAGNYTAVGIIVSSASGGYSIKACQVLNDE